MNIRPIQPDDYKQVEEVVKAAILETNAKDYPQSVLDLMLGVDPYQPRTKADERDYIVAEQDGIVCGVVGMQKNEVKTFFVHPTYHGTGIGTALITHIEKQIVEQGYKTSNVFSTVSARSFYEKQGYTVVREDISHKAKDPMLRFYMEKKL